MSSHSVRRYCCILLVSPRLFDEGIECVSKGSSDEQRKTTIPQRPYGHVYARKNETQDTRCLNIELIYYGRYVYTTCKFSIFRKMPNRCKLCTCAYSTCSHARECVSMYFERQCALRSEIRFVARFGQRAVAGCDLHSLSPLRMICGPQRLTIPTPKQ